MTAATSALEDLLAEFRAGKVGALARAISWVENRHPQSGALLDAVYPQVGRAWRTGVTGPPGAGKSTLVDGLARHWGAAGRSVGLVAVDPTSPFSGGALLGDRVRMDRALSQTGVYVRSMANRGSLGGLSLAAVAAADLLDAFGFQEVLLETVGVGQAEIDVAAAADTTVVVLTPASGDSVQAMKAGLMEVADLFVVNKADTPGAERLQTELEDMLGLRRAAAPRPEVLLCRALADQGVAEVAQAIERRRAADQASGRLEARRRARDLARVRRLVVEGLRAELWHEQEIQEAAARALAHGERPDEVARKLVRSILEGIQRNGGPA
ncbi:MAG: methylmalonyl Co-A mutase-associated GTPase MeaB [Planctomycetota bacterium]|nr:MAG: methylmalonyl Co-A mutase-associated GTPase MeaB [Planctomycetota bacterium]